MAHGASVSEPVTCTAALEKSSQELPRFIMKKKMLWKATEGFIAVDEEVCEVWEVGEAISKMMVVLCIGGFQSVQQCAAGWEGLRCRVTVLDWISETIPVSSFSTRTILSQGLQALLIPDPVLLEGKTQEQEVLFFPCLFPALCG